MPTAFVTGGGFLTSNLVRLLVVQGCLTLLACGELPAIETGVCGNHVIEPGAGEDCDGFATEKGTSCRPPGVEKQCRFECSPGATGSGPRCPSGMACGADAICRSPSGKYAAGATLAVEGARAVDVGDLDGDGRKEAVVVQRSSIIAEYFDGAGQLAASLTMPAASETGVAPVVGHLSTGAADDVVLSTGVGLVAALGNADRRAEYTAYPTYTLSQGVADVRVVPADLFATPAGDEALVIGTLNGASGLVFLDGTTGQLDLLQLLPGSASDLAGEVAKGRIGSAGMTPPCDALILSYAASSELLVIHPCKQDATGAGVLDIGGPIGHVALPVGATVTRAATLTDVNADGRPDLVLVAARGKGSIIAVAYGVADGTFHSDARTLPASSGDQTASTYVDLGSTEPIAIADLDADGVLDYVSKDGIYLGRPPGGALDASSYALYGVNAATPWTEAIVGDFNDNGHLDVVATSDAGVELDFFSGAGDGSFTPTSIPSKTPMSHLTAGDFDGDFVQDVGLVRRASTGDAAGGDSLAIFFGRLQGAPETGVDMGRVGAARQLVKTRVGQRSSVVPATDNLIVVTTGDDGSILFDGFTGQSDRQIRSPYALTDSSNTGVSTLQVERFLPARLAVGDFDGDGHADVAALGRDAGKNRLWLIPATGEGNLVTTAATDGDLLSTAVDFAQALMGANDLDGDGTDELVLFAPKAGAAAEGQAYVARATMNAGGQRQWVVDPPVDEKASFSHVEAPDGVTGATLRAGDIDGDGRADLVVPETSGTTRRLLFIRNDGLGRLTKPVTLDGTADAGAFALVRAGAGKGQAIAVLEGDDVFLLSEEPGGPFRRSSSPVASLAGATLIAAGDFNGDGLDDLALVSDQALSLFTAVPVLP